jgi:hypothetical protein
MTPQQLSTSDKTRFRRDPSQHRRSLIVDGNPERGSPGAHLVILVRLLPGKHLFREGLDGPHPVHGMDDSISDLELHENLPMSVS